MEVIKFGVCTPCAETFPSFWEEFTQELEKVVPFKVDLKLFNSLREEKEEIEKKHFHLYYASPEIAYLLRERGYKVWARFKDSGNRFLIVKKKNKVEKNRIALLCEKFILLGIFLSSLPLKKIELLFTISHKQTLEALREEKAHYGVFYENYWKNLSEEVKSEFIVEEIGAYPLYHYFLVEPEFYKKYRENLNFLCKKYPLEVVAKEEAKYLEELDEKISLITEFLKNRELIKHILSHPNIHIAIYKEYFVYVNDNFLKVTGYTLEEFTQLKPEEIVWEKDRERVKSIVQRRLAGEKFPVLYEELGFKCKDGAIRYFFVLSQTIFYEDSYAGLIIAIDITEKKIFENFYKILKELNQYIIEIEEEEKLLENVAKLLVKYLGLKLVWLGIVDENKLVRPILGCGEEISYLEKVKIVLDETQPEGRGPTAQAILQGKIVINENTLLNPQMKPWREELLKRNLLSSCAIPIYKKGQLYRVLNLYASSPYFFNEHLREILYELKRDLEYALEKIEVLREYQLLHQVIEKSREWILITDREGRIMYSNPFVSEISGYSKEELLGKTPNIFKSGLHSKEFYQELWETVLSGRSFSSVIVNRTKEGNFFKLEETIHPVKLSDEEIRFIILGRDLTKEEFLSEEIEKLKYYDHLTGVYNFSTFSFKAKEILEEEKPFLALLIIDIYNFSLINFKYGPEIGSKVLKITAERLRQTFEEEGFIARTGGDEFSLLIFKLEDKEDIPKVLEKVRSVFETPFLTEKGEIEIGFNAGVVIYPEDGKTLEELYKKAVLLVKEAKREGENFIKFSNPLIEKDFEKHIQAEILIKRALEKDLFTFFYQPYYDTHYFRLAGLEALIRIVDKASQKIYYPSDFIDHLEDSKYLEFFENWAFQKIIQQIEKWKVPISLNLSARSFFNETFILNLCKKIPESLASYFCLEITERSLMKDLERAKKIIQSIKVERNIKLALDDFGTGYSSLIHISELPLDLIKIDRIFIQKLSKSHKNMALVKVIIDLAHTFEMKVCAEGVENEEEVRILDLMGCDYLQGFHFNQPLPEEKVEELLRR